MTEQELKEKYEKRYPNCRIQVKEKENYWDVRITNFKNATGGDGVARIDKKTGQVKHIPYIQVILEESNK